MITGACLVIMALVVLYAWGVVEQPVRGTSMAELRLRIRRDVLHLKVCAAVVVVLIAIMVTVNVGSF